MGDAESGIRCTMSIVEAQLNRWGQPTRVIDTRKVAQQIVEHWMATSSDGSPESLMNTLDDTLKQIVIQLCDA